MPELSLEDRKARMDRLLVLIRAIFGRRLLDTEAIHKAKLAGIPRQLLFAWMSNIEAHRVFIFEHPEVSQFLVQHALDTDDLETSFGMLQMKDKPNPNPNPNPNPKTLTLKP